MDLDLRPFPDVATSLLTMAVWAFALALLVGTIATAKRWRISETAIHYKVSLSMLGFIGAFHAMAGFQAAQLIAACEAVLFALLWVLARTLPPRALDEEDPATRR